jgi:hypothetical protein
MQVQKMYKQEEISGIGYLYDAFLPSSLVWDLFF